MGGELILQIGSEAIKTVMMVSMPLLGLGLVVGLSVSIFQSVTQIQEMTLTFIPKMVAITVGMFIFGSWMLEKLLSFTHDVFKMIPQIVG